MAGLSDCCLAHRQQEKGICGCPFSLEVVRKGEGQPSKHQVGHDQIDPTLLGPCLALIIPGQSAVPPQPGKSVRDGPAPRQHDKRCHFWRQLAFRDANSLTRPVDLVIGSLDGRSIACAARPDKLDRPRSSHAAGVAVCYLLMVDRGRPGPARRMDAPVLSSAYPIYRQGCAAGGRSLTIRL